MRSPSHIEIYIIYSSIGVIWDWQVLENQYEAPQSALDYLDDEQPVFYVVSMLKFTVLYIATFGLYSLYWFYKHWSLYKAATNANIWPIPRAIFSIFFVNRLFKEIDDSLEDEQDEFQWNPEVLAAIYIVVSVISHIMDRAAEADKWLPYSAFVSLLGLPILFYTLYKAQQAANLAEADPEGSINNNFTGLNVFWIVLGILLWLVIGVGFLDMFGLITIPVE